MNDTITDTATDATVDAEWLDSVLKTLRNCPCSCTRRWHRDGAESVVVKECRRCRVVREWDAKTMTSL